MGEIQSRSNNSKLITANNPIIQRYLAPKPRVTPYREGFSAPGKSVLTAFIDPNSELNLSQSYAYNRYESPSLQPTFPSNREQLLKSSIRKDQRNNPQTFGAENYGYGGESRPIMSETRSEDDYQYERKSPTRYGQGEGYSDQAPIMGWMNQREAKQRSPRRDEEGYYPRDREPTFSNGNPQRNKSPLERRSNSQYLDEQNETDGRDGREYDNRPRFREEELRRQETFDRRRNSPPKEEFFGREQEISPFRNRNQPKRQVDFEDRYTRDERREKSPIPVQKKPQKEEKPAFVYRNRAEERFSLTEIEILRENYDTYAKDGRLNKYSLLKLLSLEDFEDSVVGNRIYNSVRKISSKEASFGNYVSYEKYIQAMAILARGSSQERLEFIFQIFDPNGDGNVTTEELNNVLRNMFKILRSAKFEHHTLNMLNERISEIDEEEIDSLLEEIIKEIFSNYAEDQSFLTYEEWKNWFTSQFGIFDVLNYKIKKLDTQ